MAISLLVGVKYAFSITSQLIFDNCRAIWLEEKTFIYLRRSFFSIPRDDIESLSAGVTARANSPAITLNLRNGTVMQIPTRTLSETREIVMARLAETLDIPNS